MKIRQNFLKPNFLTYLQTHSHVLGINTSSGQDSVLLTPPSYKIAPYKGTITGVDFISTIDPAQSESI